MKTILITGATGNVGFEVIRALYKRNTRHKLIAAVRDPAKARQQFQQYPDLGFTRFDFEDPATFSTALQQADCVFLLRPPQLSNTRLYFKPLISAMQAHGISELLFLSVQGAEKSSFIPHHKIEKLVLEKGLPYIFLRPSYFMQNLTTTLLSDIRQKGTILLPAGKASFNWIDVQDIGEVAARLLENFEAYKGEAYELTGAENENFYTVAGLISKLAAKKVVYRSLNPFRFYWLKSAEGMPRDMVLVMMMLHFLPRLMPAPVVSTFYERIMGKKPTSLQQFIVRERVLFQ